MQKYSARPGRRVDERQRSRRRVAHQRVHVVVEDDREVVWSGCGRRTRTAVGGQGAERVVQAGAEGEGGGHRGEFGARSSRTRRLLRVRGSAQRQVRTLVASPSSQRQPAGDSICHGRPVAPACGEDAHRQVPVGRPAAAYRQGQCCPAVVLMDVDMDVGHGVPQRLGVPTALRQPVVAGKVDIQGVRGRKRAQQQTADRLDDKGLLPVVAEADAGAEHRAVRRARTTRRTRSTRSRARGVRRSSTSSRRVPGWCGLGTAGANRGPYR